jgi:hypothetical protein
MYVMACVMVAGVAAGCGDEGTEADRIGVGAQCTDDGQCESADEQITLVCLRQFTGGYCGLEGCTSDAKCPEGSACVTNDDTKNYCYRLCQEKSDCNRNRDEENWANCVGSGTINFVDGGTDRKACEPPSSGQ